MTGRVRTIDLGPAAIDVCDTDHSSHRPDAVEWAESTLHLRELMQTRSGRFMPVADLPGHGWVQEVDDLMMTMPWRAEGAAQTALHALAARLQLAWQSARARGLHGVRASIDLPGEPGWTIDMTMNADVLNIRLSCSDPVAVRWMEAHAEALSLDLQERLGTGVRIEVAWADPVTFKEGVEHAPPSA